MSDQPKHVDAVPDDAPALPPGARSPLGFELTAASRRGALELQVCTECGTVQYPPREACHRCLSTGLTWRGQPDGGELLSETRLHHSHEAYFRERLPWRIGIVRLDCGPMAITHVAGAVPSAPCRVRVMVHLDESGQAVLVALPEPRPTAGATAGESGAREARSGTAAERGGTA